MKVEVLTDPVS